MDNTDKDKRIILTKRKKNPDGSVTTISKLKKKKKRKVVIARGTGEHTIGNVLVSQLAPFKKAMIAGLQRHGYNTIGLPFSEVISLYYNEYVSNKENTSNPFLPINRYEFRNNPAWKIKPSDNINGDEEATRNKQYFTDIDTVVNGIITMFSEAKKVYNNALMQGTNPKEVMNADEIYQAKAASKVERELENKLTDSHPVSWSNLKNIFLWVLIFYIVYSVLV